MNALESKSATFLLDNIEVSTRFPDRSLKVAASKFGSSPFKLKVNTGTPVINNTLSPQFLGGEGRVRGVIYRMVVLPLTLPSPLKGERE